MREHVEINRGYCPSPVFTSIISALESSTGLPFGYVKSAGRVKYCTCESLNFTVGLLPKRGKRPKYDAIFDTAVAAPEMLQIVVNKFYKWLSVNHPEHPLLAKLAPVSTIEDCTTFDTYAETLPRVDVQWAADMMKTKRHLLPVLLVGDYL